MENKILSKLRKMLRHEASAREIGSQAEADAFAAKIQSFADEYNLSLTDIDLSERQKTVGVQDVDINIRLKWKKSLLAAIAQVNGCIAIWDPRSQKSTLAGDAVDREIVVELFKYFEELGVHLSEKMGDEMRPFYKGSRGEFKSSFLIGYVVSLSSRLRKQHQDNMRAAQQQSSSTALVYIGNKLQRAQEAVRTEIGRTRTNNVKMTASHEVGYAAGRDAGNAVALTNKTL